MDKLPRHSGSPACLHHCGDHFSVHKLVARRLESIAGVDLANGRNRPRSHLHWLDVHMPLTGDQEDSVLGAAEDRLAEAIRGLHGRHSHQTNPHRHLHLWQGRSEIELLPASSLLRLFRYLAISAVLLHALQSPQGV